MADRSELRYKVEVDIDELCLYLVIFFLSVYVARTLQKYQQRYFVSVLMGAKRTRLHGESDDWKKFPIPPGLESPMSFTFVAVGNESEQDPSQAASTSTIISIGKLKSSVRCRPWILDDHVDHMEEDSGCEADKKNTMASVIAVVTELPVIGRRRLISMELVEMPLQHGSSAQGKNGRKSGKLRQYTFFLDDGEKRDQEEV
ncbi:hypothetical protein CQW23_13741 [Capsicum baccatum]|uniref:Uncharacterized protein n=1 Tax=Capsicum baccatum TaxID=33114 RepID=A0A2G2WH80_CAPBA|nr:hypothetical protein CQW23_13741 [Capsicum baccatum]